MNKTAIKNFAIWARVNLIESAKQRAYEYEITNGGQNNPNAEIIAGRPLSRNEQNQRKQLIEQIRIKGFDQVMEEAAYTWFNRFIALRFMEVNGYLPSKVRVFTDENGEFKPEILKEAMTVELDGLDREKVLDLLDKQDNEALYKMLLITQCNSLSAGLPYMFEKIANWTELLFPANLLKADSVIGQMIASIPEEDWMDAVQIIGWMYQYYNSELKDETFALLKKNVKITKERIPAATQLFTPDWIVRYMVENSLGRIYIQRKLVNSGDWLVADEATKVTMEKQVAEAMGWKYYLPEAEQEPEVREQLIVISNSYTGMKVEDIKVIDPCMGSGHILVYAFDVLMQIYTASSWSERDAAKSIIENNIYGLDIDDRAGQLAYFAVMMKARKYNRRILNGEIRPNVMAIQESSFMTQELINYVAAGNKDILASLAEIKNVFTDAKEYGSILNVKLLDFGAIYHRIEEIETSTPEDLFAMQNRDTATGSLLLLVNQAKIMAHKYEVVVTNPPYAGVKGLSPKLSDMLANQYPDTKADLFAAFIEKCYAMASSYLAFVTPSAWMYNPRFESFRSSYAAKWSIVSLLELGSDAFEAGFGTVTFVIYKHPHQYYSGRYHDVTNEPEKTAFASTTEYICSMCDFTEMEGMKIIYRIPPKLRKVIKTAPRLQDYGYAGNGLQTNDNGRFIHEWFEVCFNKIDFSQRQGEATIKGKKWFPTVKATSSLKWYGNMISVVNWENNGAEIKALTTEKYGTYTKHVQNLKYYFAEGLTWSHSTYGAPFSIRYLPKGTIINIEGPGIFELGDKLYYALGLLNSKVAIMIFEYTTGSIHFVASDLAKFPFVYNHEMLNCVTSIVKENLHLAKCDMDSMEISWDYLRDPLATIAKEKSFNHIEDCFIEWVSICNERFAVLKANEERLNRIFIDIYDLQNELIPDVDENDITVFKAEIQRDIKRFVSYAVGCMFGRYSLDCEGLAYAGGEWDASKYTTFPADKDNIIPICDDEYFDDDIVARFVRFIETVYGKATLEENIHFIADALGGKGTPRDVIRSYFLNDFYADHLKIYQKRPIYWLFDSGKKNGFKCLIYMHRYQPDTIARIRTDYIHELQSRYRTAIADLEDRVEHASASERVKLSKQLAKIKDQELELRKYEEKIHHLADQMIEIDLDDGVKVNYAKFGDVLAKIK